VYSRQFLTIDSILSNLHNELYKLCLILQKRLVKPEKMRRDGSSLGEIALEFNISKSTASLWTSGVEISIGGKERILNKWNLAREKGLLTLSKKKRLG